MIDLLDPVTAAVHGGCLEYEPNDDRGNDLYVFVLGSFKIRLCQQHLAMLKESVARAIDARS